MFQYYLRAQGSALSCVGTGRIIFSLAYGEEHLAAVAERFVAAARGLREDGWWWLPERDAGKALRGRVVCEMLHHRLR
jgi:glutamate-1-semialdehyde 2,1-aminomutase